MTAPEERGRRAQGCPHFPGASQFRLASQPRPARAGYWHGGRLAPPVILELSGSLHASRQWSVLRALGLVKWHGSWARMPRQDEMTVLALPEMALRHLRKHAMA